jgi:hypothetical protein
LGLVIFPSYLDSRPQKVGISGGFFNVVFCCASLTGGSGDACVRSAGGNGRTDATVTPSCDAAASAGTWRLRDSPALAIALSNAFLTSLALPFLVTNKVA